MVLAAIAAGGWWLASDIGLGAAVRRAVLGVAAAAGALLPVLRRLRFWHEQLTDKAEKMRAELEKRKADLEQKQIQTSEQLKLVDVLFAFGEFVRERGTSATYQDGRGLVGYVHDDLLLLREQLHKARRQWTAGDDQAEPPERIVLYIDDLDRCPPDRVVRVLESVHLMLTLDLFVVVVAVDARWMIRSLEHHYRPFFGTEDNLISPYDYLDKIFQIPYTLVPPTAVRAAGYMRKLLPEPQLTTGPRSRDGDLDELPDPGTGLGRAEVAAAEDPADDDGAGDSAAGDSAAGDSGADDGRPPSAVFPVTDLQPPSLALSYSEVEFMARLGSLAPWPRAAKRMANLYQLVRISIPDAKLAGFLGDASDGSYRVVQVLLAILAGSPGSAREVFERILSADPDADLLDVLGPDGERPVRPNPIAEIRAKLRHLHDQDGLPLELAEYQKWCPELARYSFWTWSLARGLAEEVL